MTPPYGWARVPAKQGISPSAFVYVLNNILFTSMYASVGRMHAHPAIYRPTGASLPGTNASEAALNHGRYTKPGICQTPLQENAVHYWYLKVRNMWRQVLPVFSPGAAFQERHPHW